MRVHVVGILAHCADTLSEPLGTIGGSITLFDRDKPVHCQLLENGRHYSDSRKLDLPTRVNGDGTSVEHFGAVTFEGSLARVDTLTLDIPAGIRPNTLSFKDLGTPASFLIFDILLEMDRAAGCPFHSRSGGIALAEIASIVRVGDRVKFHRALAQLETSIRATEDMDEARGQALTFLAMVTSATLEMGGRREMHRIQLDAAREFDRIEDQPSLASAARAYAERVSADLFPEAQGPSSHLVDRALALVDRQFARHLSDEAVAAQLGLSTSHFRHLFRQATGQPFHKYVIAMRLEKARTMLVEEDVAISAVARAVGFTGLSHFSRAFTQRFAASPTHIRRGAA